MSLSRCERPSWFLSSIDIKHCASRRATNDEYLLAVRKALGLGDKASGTALLDIGQHQGPGAAASTIEYVENQLEWQRYVYTKATQAWGAKASIRRTRQFQKQITPKARRIQVPGCILTSRKNRLPRVEQDEKRA